MLTEIVVLALALVCAVLVAEGKDLMRAALGFVGLTILLGIFYILRGYVLLGVFQILVYSVAISALIFYVIALTGGGEDVEGREDA